MILGLVEGLEVTLDGVGMDILGGTAVGVILGGAKVGAGVMRGMDGA